MSCGSDDNNDFVDIPEDELLNLSDILSIDFASLPNYSNQTIPNYITKDNTTFGNT